MNITTLIQLKRLGFIGIPIDYAVSDTEGVAVYFLEKDSITFHVATTTGAISPGMFAYVCASCAAMTVGKAEIEHNESLRSVLELAIKSSKLQPYIVGEIKRSMRNSKRALTTFNFNYERDL